MKSSSSIRSKSWSRRTPRGVLAGFAFASILFHVVAVFVIKVRQSPPLDRAQIDHPVALVGEEPGVTIDFSCMTDLVMVTGARLSWCALPIAGEGCGRAAVERFQLEAIACRDVTAPMEVALIGPEPLMPEAAPLDLSIINEEIEKKFEEVKKQEDDPDLSGQVVDLGKPAVEVRPEDAKFLSEYDTKVDKQTVNRSRANGPAGAAPSAAPPEQVAPPSSADSPETASVEPTPMAPVPDRPPAGGVLAMRGAGQGSTAGQTEATERGEQGTSPAISEDGVEQRPGDPNGGKTPGEAGQGGLPGGGGDQPSPTYRILRPSNDLLAHATGGGSNDYLPDIDDGTETLLSSKRWRYASFFNRVKRQVAQEWRPDDAYRLRDPTGNVYGTKDRLTVLQVSLKPNGSVAHILISKPCGVDFLDDEAERAFEEAQPFPNPPAGLVDHDTGLITFRFGFMFEISEGRHWKVFRYRN